MLKMSRSATCLTVLALALLGPVPMSLCATLADLPADCAPSPHCDGAGAKEQQASVSELGVRCCQITPAPLPERQSNVSVPDAGQAVTATQEVVPVTPKPALVEVQVQARSAPLNLQASLCTFRI